MHYLQSTEPREINIVVSTRNGYSILPVPGTLGGPIKDVLKTEEHKRLGAERLLQNGEVEDVYVEHSLKQFKEHTHHTETRVIATFSNPFFRLARFLKFDQQSQEPLISDNRALSIGARLANYIGSTDYQQMPIGLRRQSDFVRPWLCHLSEIVQIDDSGSSLDRLAFTLFGKHSIAFNKIVSPSSYEVNFLAQLLDEDSIQYVLDFYAEDFKLLSYQVSR